MIPDVHTLTFNRWRSFKVRQGWFKQYQLDVGKWTQHTFSDHFRLNRCSVGLHTFIGLYVLLKKNELKDAKDWDFYANF